MSPTAREFESGGVRLAGFTVEPAADAPARGARLVVCHGLPSGKPPPSGGSGTSYETLLTRFAEHGYGAVFFNFRGAGPSEGDFDLAAWVDDLRAVIDRVKSDLPLVIVGSSAGGLVSLVAASRDDRIAGVATLAAPADFRFLAKAPAKLIVAHFREIGLIRDPDFPEDEAAWFDRFAGLSSETAIGSIAPRPVLLVHGGADETVPVEHVRRLRDAGGGNCERVVLPGAGHRLRLEAGAVETVLEWLERHFG